MVDVKHVWVENLYEPSFDPTTDCADVLVETAEGELWSALFVTLAYLEDQMHLSREHALSIAMPPIQYTVIENSHVVVENLHPETIEDAIDCLIERGIFESVFARCPEDEEED
jgi:hypothetical protein